MEMNSNESFSLSLRVVIIRGDRRYRKLYLSFYCGVISCKVHLCCWLCAVN